MGALKLDKNDETQRNDNENRLFLRKNGPVKENSVLFKNAA